MNKKITIIINDELTLIKFRHELVIALINEGYEIDILSPSGEFLKKYEKLGCKLVDTPMDRRGKNILKELKLFFSYIKYFCFCKPLCILCFTIKPNIYAGIAARIFGISRINNITGISSAISTLWLENILFYFQKLSLKNAACVFFQNQENKKLYIEKNIYNGNSVLLPGSGVNLFINKLEKYPENCNTLKFLLVMRVMQDKGINELIEAIKILRKTFDNLEFHVVGMCEDGYEKKVEKWSEEGLIIYHGQQDDVHAYMKACHGLIHPSYHEGLSNVCLEAAATGRPVLASKIPGCIETFDEGITGLGFERQNVKSLVTAIIKFIKMPYSEKEKMGLLGRMKVEKEFDRKIVVDNYIKEIKKLEEI